MTRLLLFSMIVLTTHVVVSAAAASTCTVVGGGVACAFVAPSPMVSKQRHHHSRRNDMSSSSCLAISFVKGRGLRQRLSTTRGGGRMGVVSLMSSTPRGVGVTDDVEDMEDVGGGSSGVDSSGVGVAVSGLDYASIIDDGKGHINGELAQSIWEWDNSHRRQQQQQQQQQQEEEGGTTIDGNATTALLSDTNEKVNNNAVVQPKFKYSTRAGLRLVDEIAKTVLSMTSSANGATSSTSSSSASVVEDSSATSYADLVQEGVVALMRAMSSFDPTKSDSFELYARRTIYHSMQQSLADTSRPIRLPAYVHEKLRQAQFETIKYKNEKGIEPTMAEIAAILQMPKDKLQFYHLVSGGTLSVESTIEILDSATSNTGLPTFADERQYEQEHGVKEALLHSGEDELLEEEEEWVESNRIVAPLRDIVPDTNDPTPDDMALADMIRHDVNDFLTRTLDDRELDVIRMRFGLHDGSGVGLSKIQVGERLNLSRQRIGQIEERALDKLRTSYTLNYVETYLEDEHETMEDSV